MNRPSIRMSARLTAAVALAVGGLALAGCGSGGGTADLAAGKTTFKNLCSSCHSLSEAGTTPAYIGPSLDDAFRAARQVGMSDEQFRGVVRRWITIAQLPMPRNLVKGKDADNVAAYIASVAGTSPASEPFPYQTTPQVPDPPRQTPHQNE